LRELNKSTFGRASLLLLGPILACSLAKQTPQPTTEFEQLVFEVQTATPTVSLMFEVATFTPIPKATNTPIPTPTSEIAATVAIEPESTAPPAEAEPPTPAPPPPPTATVPLAEPLRGGAWDFEDGFQPWANPFADACPGSGLSNGWTAFTSRDQYGSACMNQTVWKDNVHSGESAQEITFAYVGIDAGVYRPAATIPGHRYTIDAHMRREFSPAKVSVFVGVDLAGGTNWEADSVQWFPWNEDVDDAWGATSVTVTATGETMTVFLKGSHPYPEPGGTLRLDNISIVDIGPE
jgi:hypothetical protein